jgi:hypothetical protein
MTTTFDTIEESSSSETGAVGSERLVKIRARAYELYLARGEESGSELDDWLQAELEIDKELIS